ncbi:MAG: hypothetical protein H6918_06575 [Sphingomonadaceae bacterium]|nr:hypothetical protein [Sphingomonadaceae bacterium]
MARQEIAGNAAAKRAFTVIGIRALSVLCLLGLFGAFMTKWSEESDLKFYIDEGVVSSARVLGSREDNSTIVWNNGDRGTTSYNFVRVLTDPATGIKFADFTRTGQEPALPAPPADEANDEWARTLSVNDASMAALKPGDVVPVVTHRYDTTGGMLLSEISGRDYSTHNMLMIVFAVLAVGLWLLARRLNRG